MITGILRRHCRTIRIRATSERIDPDGALIVDVDIDHVERRRQQPLHLERCDTER